jgi:hypothetical protein
MNLITRGKGLIGSLVVKGPLCTPPVTVTYVPSGTTTINPNLGSAFVITTATGNSNVAFVPAPTKGQEITLIINNDSGGARTITFTTAAKSVGTLVGTASKACTITFLSDGTNAYETGRAGAATATTGM